MFERYQRFPMPEEDMMMEQDQMMPAMQGEGHYMNRRLVKTIQECEATCEHMTAHIKRQQDFQRRVNQAVLLRDCADVCGFTAKLVSRGSVFARQAADLCSDICERCGQECARFPDQMSQNCARICMHCARECRAFAGTM